MPAVLKFTNPARRANAVCRNMSAALRQQSRPQSAFDLANNAFGDRSKRLPVLKILACRFHGSTMPWGSAHVAEADG
jgi:hypothetical protein